MDKHSPWRWADTECETCGKQQIRRTTTMYVGGRAVRTDPELICGDPECATNRGRKYV